MKKNTIQIRQMSKAHPATLTLCSLTIPHLVLHMHCILDACQQQALAPSALYETVE